MEHLEDLMFCEYPDVVDIKDMMKMLSVGRNTALNLLKTSRIRGVVVGNRYRIPKINVIRFLLGDKKAS